MKKYDLILVALYVAFLLILWGVLKSYVYTNMEDRREVNELVDAVSRTDLKAVVIRNTEMFVKIRRTDEDRVQITGGNLRQTNKEAMRLSGDTLYIGSRMGADRDYIRMTIPDSMQVILSAAPNVDFEE